MKWQVVTAAALGALAIAFFAAPADALPLGSTSVICTNVPRAGQLNQSQSCAGSGGPAETDAATAELAGTSVRVSGSVQGVGGNYDPGTGPGSADAFINYYFTVLAPPGYVVGTPIPVLVDTLLQASQGTGGYANTSSASAQMTITDQFGTRVFSQVAATDPDPNNAVPVESRVSGTFVAELLPGEQDLVSLVAGITLRSNAPTEAAASADPYIRVDPAFLADNPGYSVIVSDNVTNVPLPEPKAIWLVGSASLGLIAARRRRSRVTRV
jgi:hypothetical protein